MNAPRISANDSPNNSAHSAYYAVSPQLVIKAANLFGIQSSILERGAKSLYDKASNIESGRDTTRWGRHKQSVIEQFCEYTTVQKKILPWHELVEHFKNYDGKEGITPRTGNKPLATVRRLRVQRHNLKTARSQNRLSLQTLAQNTALPEPFLEALESGEWPTVSQSTAESIAASLAIPVDELFLDLNPKIESKANQTIDTASSLMRYLSLKTLSLIIVGICVLLSIIFFVLTKNNSVELAPQSNTKNITRFINSHWFGTIAQADKAIYINPQDTEFWTKGTYIYLRKNGSIGFNQTTASNYLLLPHPETRWAFTNNQLTISFGELYYSFDLENQHSPETLVTVSNEGSWELTLKAVAQEP